MPEYEQSTSNIIIYSFSGVIVTVVVIGAIVGIIIDTSENELWKSLLLLISGAAVTILKEAAAAGFQQINRPPLEVLIKEKKDRTKRLAQELPPEYQTKILKALWKLAPPETKEHISKSDSEESFSKKSSKGLKSEIGINE